MSTHRRTSATTPAAADEPPAGVEGFDTAEPIDVEPTPPSSGVGLASDLDVAGIPVHRGWAPIGGRRRWMEPFLLVILAGGPTHGYAIIGDLEEMGITGGPVDIGQVYRTLRELEEAGQVTSVWSTEQAGPQRRDYELTEVGYAALDEWAAVMKERGRLIGEFDGRYLEWVARERRTRS
jgi:PadR family transcriptional regulator, regulatory protein PadR